MTTRQDIIDFVRVNPGCATKDFARVFAVNTNDAATRLKQVFDAGYIRREVAAVTKGRPSYAYWVVEASVGKLKKERLAIVKNLEPNTHDKPIVGNTLDSMLSDFVGSFAASLAGAIVDQLKPRLEQELRKVLPAALPSPALMEVQQAKPEKVRLPRIGILGVATAKRASIDEEFDTIFDITYWCSDDGDLRLKPMAHSCEMIFVMDYVGHKHTQLLTSRGANMRRVNGDIRAMQDMLTSYYIERTAA